MQDLQAVGLSLDFYAGYSVLLTFIFLFVSVAIGAVILHLGAFVWMLIFTIQSFLTLLFPLSISFAMLRSRLWDIDALINRTLVYSMLTASLALLYVGLVLVLQFLLRGMISQTSDIAIVGSTLAIAAVFQPLRHHFQRVIDRRFYRQKYDAARTLAVFSAALRNEVDLEQLSEQMVAVVEETMQPTHVSLWLRQPYQFERQRERLLSE